jgi:hypothetical protein
MSEFPEIIGIAGTNASLKGTLAARRFETQGAVVEELSNILRTEATLRGLPHERENLRAISTEWGRKMGAGALATMTLDHYYETRTDASTGISVVSIRRPAEARVIQENGGAVIWLDADREVRYARILSGNRNRVDDLKTFEEFASEEDVEMHPSSDDPFLINMSGVRDIADIHVDTTFAGADEAAGRQQFNDYLSKRFNI